MFERLPARIVAQLIACILLGSGLSAAAPSGGGCDRACLHGLVDQYLTALVAHDPARLRTTSDVKFTENTNRMTLGDGLWQTIDGLGTFKLYIEDPQSGQAAFYGTVQENGVEALLGLRLKERGRRLAEIETFVVREASGIHGKFDALVEADPLWERPLPPSERSGRRAMVEIANRYFEGIVRGDGDIVPFAPDFTRVENGLQTAGPTGPSPAAQFSSKRFNYIHEITDRRFLLVDPERGIVYAVVMFQHPGNIKTGLFAAGPPGAGPPGAGIAGARRFNLASYPNTTQIVETFRIRRGRIDHIFAYVSLLPYRQRTGW